MRIKQLLSIEKKFGMENGQITLSDGLHFVIPQNAVKEAPSYEIAIVSNLTSRAKSNIGPIDSTNSELS